MILIFVLILVLVLILIVFVLILVFILIVFVFILVFVFVFVLVLQFFLRYSQIAPGGVIVRIESECLLVSLYCFRILLRIESHIAEVVGSI